MSHRVETVYFDGKGKQYTEETLKLAKKRADELGIKNIVVASYTGYAGVLASEIFVITMSITPVTYSLARPDQIVKIFPYGILPFRQAGWCIFHGDRYPRQVAEQAKG